MLKTSWIDWLRFKSVRICFCYNLDTGNLPCGSIVLSTNKGRMHRVSTARRRNTQKILVGIGQIVMKSSNFFYVLFFGVKISIPPNPEIGMTLSNP